MEFDSPDVEKDFPGLYASESADGKSRKSKEESDFSDAEHDKMSKKDLLIGKRKDKKDKSKDRGYAALEGESSPDEGLDTKSPSKSKKSKTFKFTSSKSKEKREKSRDKERQDRGENREEDKIKEKEKPDKEDKDKKDKDQKKKEKDKDKDKKEKEKDKKDKDKDKTKDKAKEKEKDKVKEKEKTKDKEKEKDKKDKKHKSNIQNQISTEEVLELDYPVFGVSISIATDRSRCHDGIDLPLVVRDCVDYLQENCLKHELIYKVEPIKSRLMHFKKLYNSRERVSDNDPLDVNTSCALLKLFLRELPEPVLTTDLIGSFEELASPKCEESDKMEKLKLLIEQLPQCNQTLLCWILLHFHSVVEHEVFNKVSATNLATLLSPTLQMSHRLLLFLITICKQIFPNVKLIKYVPPLTSSSPKLPDTIEEIHVELKKQESLLSQLHTEMNAGFVTKKREEQLWEVQRIITQLKRKLRSFEKKQEKSIDELDHSNNESSIKNRERKQGATSTPMNETKSQQQPSEELNNTNIEKSPISTEKEWFVDEVSGMLMLPKTHPDFEELLRLQLENQELLSWKTELQARISAERAEVLRLKQLHQQTLSRRNGTTSSIENSNDITNLEPSEYEKIIENFVKENNLLEQKKQILTKNIFDENRECIALQVKLIMQQQY